MIVLRPKRARGFSLIEIGIVIAAIAVLSAVVLMGSGYMRAARTRNAMEQISMLRQAAKQFAARVNNGLTYFNNLPGVANPASTRLSIASLDRENLITLPVPGSTTMESPWGTKVAIEPADRSAHEKCEGWTCMRICMETEPEDGCTTCNDMREQFRKNSIAASCGSSGCGIGGSCVLVVLSR